MWQAAPLVLYVHARARGKARRGNTRCARVAPDALANVAAAIPAPALASLLHGDGGDDQGLRTSIPAALERALGRKAPDSNRNRWLGGHFPLLAGLPSLHDSSRVRDQRR
jgi:hypothetical protein